MAKRPRPTDKACPNPEATGGKPDDDWEDIDPGLLDSAQSTPPAFPLDTLPERLRGIVDGISKARHVAIDFIASSLIAIAAGTIGNRVRLAITPERTEPGAIFMALVASPGEGKSEGLGISRACFNALESGLVNGVPSQAETANAELTKVELSRTRAARARLAAEGVAPISSVGGQASSSQKFRLLLSEATVVGIRDGLAGAPEGRTFLTDELLTMTNLSSGRDQVRARGLILESWDGNRTVIANGRDGEIEIEALQLTIIGGTQPDLVGQLIGKLRDGMASRFLWCAPSAVRVDELAEEDGPIDQFITALRQLVQIRPNGIRGHYPALLPISPEAREILRIANSGWNARFRMAPPVMKSLLARARNQALRLSMTVALCERALAGESLPGAAITQAEAEVGIALVDLYYLPMGERVVVDLAAPITETPSTQLARYLVGIKLPKVNARDDIRKGRGSPLRDIDEIESALEELRLRGAVKKKLRSYKNGGRPTFDWIVSPKLFKLLG